MASENLLRKPLTIYVAGPYTPTNCDLHDAARIAEQNTQRAIRAGIEIMLKGHYPYIPHLTHFVHIQMKNDEALKGDYWYQYDLKWIGTCDALLYLAPSRGADVELKYAQEHGFQIFRSLDEIPNIANGEIEKHRVKSV